MRGRNVKQTFVTVGPLKGTVIVRSRNEGGGCREGQATMARICQERERAREREKERMKMRRRKRKEKGKGEEAMSLTVEECWTLRREE